MMQNKYQYLANNPRSKLSYICAEATSLPFTDCTYNMVLDKGTLDAAIRHQHGELIGQKIVAEALRVMACPSKLIQISDEDPDLRLQFLSNCCKIYDEKTKLYKTSVKFLELGTFNGIEYIMYTIEKGLSQPSPAT